MFESVKMTEEKILDFWERKKIPEKARNLRKGKKKFFFMDGPPYATGFIHLGTAKNKILKDCYIRFFRMLGYDVWDQPGYDTHGLPIENKVEKKLGFKRKADIEAFGIENFIKECEKFATQFIDVMNKQFANLGVWMNWKNPYLTLTNDYIEGAWATFKKGFEKGLLFKGKYPVHVCPHCETAVAYNEIEYKKVSEQAIYVKFKVEGKENEFLLIWTTTPWTLPANTGVMAKPNADYVKVKVNDEVLILAKDLAKTVLSKVGIENYKIIKTLKGKELEGLRYKHPFPDLFPFQKHLKNAHRVVLSERYVTLDEGTGLVHTAPGHGKEDYEVGKESGLPIVCPVKMDGSFDETCGKFSGIYVKDADKLIVEELKKRNLLFHAETITHDYPHCWRCKSPLLLLTVEQWFFRVTGMRDKLIEENEKVNWVPEWAKKRFRNWLESLGDWPISRQRYWGIPLPIWICEKCNEIKVVGSREELNKVPEDFHRPYIDEVILKCRKCGSNMKRIPDVLDVWFDSGVASWASLGYPKEKKLWKELWPADLNIEGVDQIRGWWNSQLITSVITFDKAPYKNILFHGFIYDEKGQPMSKSLGNIVMPEEVIDKYGRDVLRAFLLSKPPWENLLFKWKEVEEIAKNFNVIRNTFNFVQTYVKEYPKQVELKVEDKWILSKLNSLVKKCRDNFEKLNGHEAVQDILDFILNDFSRWYIKLIRERVWPMYNGDDKQAAFYTLINVTEVVSELLAPICPFMAEEIYQNVVKKFKDRLESVHLADYPKEEKKLMDKELEEQMSLIKEIVEASYAARQKAKLKLRWPVKKIVIVTKDKRVIEALKNLKDVFIRMTNTKEVEAISKKPKGEFSSSEFNLGEVLVDLTEDDEIKQERLYRELTRQIQALRKKYRFKVEEKIRLTLNSDEKTNEVLKKFVERFHKDVGASEVVIGKLEGKFSGKLEFERVEIEIKFDRAE
jgi:isoleucyl-tRNA synthetase